MRLDLQIAASGRWGTIEWAVLQDNAIPQAREFYLAQSESDKAKLLVLFQRLAEVGRFSNTEKFKQLGEHAGKHGKGLWEFKSFQLRFLGDFRPGCRFILAQGVRKKQDDLRKSDIEKAIHVLDVWDRTWGGQK